jgi:hypothetical protein
LTSLGCEGLIPNKSLIRNINFYVAERYLLAVENLMVPAVIPEAVNPVVILEAVNPLEIKKILKTPFLKKIEESLAIVKNIKNLSYYNIFIEFFKKWYYGKSYSNLNKFYLPYEQFFLKNSIKPQILNQTSFCNEITKGDIISKKKFILKEDLSILKKTTSELNNNNTNKTLIAATLTSVICFGIYLYFKNKL